MATIEGEHAVMLRDLCLIASLISDKPTKLKVQAEVVVFRLSTMLTTTTNNLQTINGWLPNIQNTATVVQANRLKDDVKGFQAKVREILDAIFKQAGIENKSPSK
jgi:hypothetical protein